MDHHNSDGSQAQMCGNGIRCLAKLVYDRGLIEGTEVRVDTRSGVKTLSLHVEDGVVGSVTVGMGPARFARGTLPMAGDPGDVRRRAVRGRRAQLQGDRRLDGEPAPGAVRRGGPRRRRCATLGPLVEHDERFPERTNVEFVAVQETA